MHYHYIMKGDTAHPVTRHIIWDWNGTLLDDVQACIRAANRMLAPRNLQPLDPERYRRIFGFPVRGYYTALGFDFAREDWDMLAREFHDHYHIESRSATLREGIGELLVALAAHEIPMSILSASESSILTRMLREQEIEHHFEHVFGLSDLYAGSKSLLGRKLLDRLALPPAEVLLVGDTIHDYEVACELECRCVLLAGGHQATDRLQQCKCPVLMDSNQLVQMVRQESSPPS